MVLRNPMKPSHTPRPTWLDSKLTHFVIACATISLFSCANELKEENKPASTAPQLVGRIASAPPGRSFVLIQSYGPWTQPPGTVLTTRGENDRTANLRFSGETLGQFSAADIQSGTVVKGDAVYSLHTPSPKVKTFPSLEASPAAAPSEPPALPDEPALPDQQPLPAS
jgi:hypothetical protein